MQSLCNACGIRQRKAKRAIAAAANGAILVAKPTSMKSAPAAKVQHKDKRSRNGYVPKLKKKCKLSTATTPSHQHGRKKLCFEDFTISLSKNSAFQRVFPEDEKDAAILLMALSYGLVHGWWSVLRLKICILDLILVYFLLINIVILELENIDNVSEKHEIKRSSCKDA